MKKNNPYELEVVSIRLVKDAPIISDKPITMPEDAVELLGEYLCQMDREMMCVINLKADGTPINCNIASIGAVDSSIAHPRELFKSSILSNASKMILVHNHPSSSIKPSEMDTMLTDRMVNLGSMMGIPIIDHIIVGGDNSQFFSFKAGGIMPFPKNVLRTDYKKVEFQTATVAEKGRAR